MKLIIRFLIILIVFILFSSFGWCEEIETYLKSDSLRYDEDAGILIASGEVHVSLEGVSLKADELIMNVNVNIITAEGNVYLEARGHWAKSDVAIYWVSNEVASLRNFSAEINSDQVNGTVFLTSEELFDYVKKMEGKQGSVTTCDYSNPHYVTKAHKVVYFPDDKVVGYSVTFYINNTPVMWVPVVVYSLKSSRSKMPIVGHNEVEGDFIKTTWDYYINQENYGLLYLDQMSKKGFGHGIEHDYYLNDKSKGKLFLYHLNEADTGLTDWVSKIEHELKISEKTTLFLGYTAASIYLLPGGRADETKFNLDLNYNDTRKVNFKTSLYDNRQSPFERYTLDFSHKYESYATSFSWKNEQNKAYPRWRRFDSSFAHSQNLADNLSMAYNMRYFYNTTSEVIAGNSQLDPYVEFKYSQPDYTVRYIENWHLDLDDDLYLSDINDEYLERQPEIIVNPKDVTWNSIKLSSEFSYGWFHEAKYVTTLGRVRHFTASRYKTRLDANRDVPLGWGTTLGLNGGISQQMYDTGDARYGLHEEFKLTTDLFSFFHHEARYKRDFAEGNTPFLFDQIGSINADFRDQIKFYHGTKVVWTTDGGYNFDTKKYYPVNTRLDIKPDTTLGITFRTGFDIEHQRYLDFVAKVSYLPHKKFRTDLNAIYELNYGNIKAADSLFDFEIGDTWQDRWNFRFTHRLDVFNGEFKLMDMMIVKDLHCWEMKYIFSEYRKEYAISFTLKAFPDIPVGWTTGRGFYFEGFEKAKGEVMGEFDKESPRRY